MLFPLSESILIQIRRSVTVFFNGSINDSFRIFEEELTLAYLGENAVRVAFTALSSMLPNLADHIM